jgi:transposase
LISGLDLPNPLADFRLHAAMEINPVQLNTEQLLELVRQLIAENEKLRTDSAQLLAEIEELKRKNARPAAPFSKNKRKKNPNRPGRRPGQGEFSNRTAPSVEDYSGPIEDVPVQEPACPKCGGDLIGDDQEIVTNTEMPPAPRPEIKAYRVHSRTCCRCKRKVRGRHPEVAQDQFGATAHRLGPRAQAAARTLHYGDDIPQSKVPGVLRSLTGLIELTGRTSQAIVSGHEAGAQLASISKFLPYIKENEKLVDIIKGSLNYAQLFLSVKPRLSGLEKWLINEDIPVEKWLEGCIHHAWNIVVARESRGVSKKDEIFGKNGIIDAFSVPIKCTYICQPSHLLYSPSPDIANKYEALPWDISRWVLAALSNAIKWSGPKTSQEKGFNLLKEWSKLWEEKGFSPFKPTLILIISDREKEETEIKIYNGYYKNERRYSRRQDGKADGTERVLNSISYSLPNYYGSFKFDNYLTTEELSLFLPGEEWGFETSIRLKCVLFQSAASNMETTSWNGPSI